MLGRKVSRVTLVILLALAVGAAFGAPGTAVAATKTGPANFSAASPPDGGGTSVVRPTITVQANDPLGLLSSPFYALKVDGKAQSAAFAYKAVPGGYDRTWATLTYTPKADLSQGTHTVYVSVCNSKNTYSTYTWSFTVSNTPKLSLPSPAPGSTVTTDRPVISAKVTQSTTGIVPHVYVDGTEIPSGYDSANQLVSATPVNKLVNDTSHDVTVTVTNAVGNSDTLPWKFNVQIYPDMPVESGCTVCHTTFPSAHPMDNCYGCHGIGSPVGEGWSTPDYSAHSWTYVTACTGCHVESGYYTTVPALHPFGDDTYHDSAGACSPCHVKSLPTEHYRYGKNCQTCHSSTDPKVQMAISMGQTDCLACHSNANHESLHVVTPDDCSECHGATSLTTTHIIEQGLTCNTCHKSTDPRVQNAIATHQRQCTACHDAHPLDADFCYGCHITNNGSYNGKKIAQSTDHLTMATSTKALTVYPGSGAPAASCVNCHDDHKGSTRAAGNALCYACHDDASVVLPASYSYRGSATYQASPHGGSVTSDLTNSVLRSDSAGFMAYESITAPTPTNPGTTMSADKIDALTTEDGVRAVTMLSNVTGGTDYQVYRFKVPTPTANIKQLVARWTGFGEETAGYPVAISIWNKTLSSGSGDWEQLFSGDTAQQAAVKATETTPAPYVDASGYVWMMAKAKNVRDADIVSAPAVGGNTSSVANVSWTTLGPCDSWVDYGPTAAYGSTVGTSARSTAHNVSVSLPGAGIYHYRVRSVSRDGDSYTSPDRTFGAPSPTLVTVPDDYNTVGARTVALQWSEPLAGGAPYTYLVRVRDPYSGNVLWSQTVIGSNIAYVTLDAGSYSWDVTATDKNGVSFGTSYASSFTFWYPGASCPTLYTWNGSQYVFQTDVMTRGFLGLQLGNKLRYPIANEDTVIDSSKLRSENGQLLISLKDDNDEIEFVDNVAIKAVDHPAGTKVVLDDLNPYSFSVTAAPETIHTVRDVRPVVSATYDCQALYRGYAVSNEDVTARVTSEDGLFAPAQLYDDNRYTFDLGNLGANPAAVKLVLTGWTQYPTTGERNAYKASGATGATRVLEVQAPDGSWIAVQGGLPVLPGYKKTAVFDLTGKFPAGTTDYKVRLRGWFRTNVDFVGVDTSANEAVSVTQLSAASSTLSYSGISRFVLDDGTGYPSYSYDQPLPIRRTHDGDFTKFGDVSPLTSAKDDKFVVMDSGDELKMSFPDGGQPATGQVRTYVIHADGYHQTLTGNTDPLPFGAMSNYPYPANESYPTDADHTQYRQEWNTRHNVAALASLDLPNPVELAQAAAGVVVDALRAVADSALSLVSPNVDAPAHASIEVAYAPPTPAADGTIHRSLNADYVAIEIRYQDTAVAAGSCETCHAVHGQADGATGLPVDGYLVTRQDSLCTGQGEGGCHASAANSVNGVNIAAKFSNSDTRTHHNISEADQKATGSKVACADCHNAHADSASRLYSNPDSPGQPGQSFATDYLDANGNMYVAVAAQHDGVAPVISFVSLSAVATDYLNPIVTWTTNEAATTSLQFGTTVAYGTTVAGPGFGTSHSMKMPLLKPSTLYHYRVVSTDAVGNTAYGADRTYTTPGFVTSGVVLSPGADYLSPTVTYTTNGPGTSIVDWGTTIAYGQTKSDPALVNSHSINPGPLTAGTLYHYRVRSVDARGNIATSTDFTYTPIQTPAAPTLNPAPDITDATGPFPQTFSWSPVTSPDGHAVQYNVEVAGVASSGWITVAVTSAPSWTSPAWFYTGTYQWRVQARDAVHPTAISSWSAYDTFNVTETNPWVPGSSCPILYTWDGSKFAFQTDVMTRGFLGLKLGASTRFPLYSEDTVIDGSKMAAENGKYTISLKDDNDEIEFVDHVTLRAVDHPVGTQVVLDDLNPFVTTPTSGAETIHTVRNLAPVASATYDCTPLYRGHQVDAQDITADVSSTDGTFAPSQFYDDNRYTFDLGQLGSDPAAVKLVLTGYTKYPSTAERNEYKASGAAAAVRALEVMDASGNWVQVPGGLPVIPGYKKTVVFDLSGKFPAGVTDYKVRLRGWFATYIDSAAVDTSADEAVTVNDITPTSADLAYKGASLFTQRDASHYPSYSYDDLVSITRTHNGDFTKFGSVMPLVTGEDDKYVIMDTGDELKVTFPAQAAPAAGMERTWVIHGDAYHQTLTGNTDPLPFKAMSNYPYPAGESYPTDADHTQYRTDWNTRQHTLGVSQADGPSVFERIDNAIASAFDRAGELVASLAPKPEVKTADASPESVRLLASLSTPPVHYSSNTDQMALTLRSYAGASTPLAPSGGYESAATGMASLLPTSGASVSQAKLDGAANADAVYWITDLATADRSYNVQVGRFNLNSAQAASTSEFSVLWSGHGEPTAGYPVTTYVWNYRTSSWEQFGSGSAPIDIPLTLTSSSVKDSFCLTCHDGTPPSGVVLPAGSKNMASLWQDSTTADFHGTRAGTGWSGTLKTPYVRGMTVACDTCHDPHGNNNLYHVRTTVNGTTGISVTTSGNSMKTLCVACHSGNASDWHQTCDVQCHASDPYHYGDLTGYTPNDSSDCAQCHGHGRGFNHPPGGCHGCHAPADWPNAF